MNKKKDESKKTLPGKHTPQVLVQWQREGITTQSKRSVRYPTACYYFWFGSVYLTMFARVFDYLHFGVHAHPLCTVSQ